MANTSTKARAVVEGVLANSSAGMQRSLSPYTKGEWGAFYNALTATPALENEFRRNLTNYVFEHIIGKATYENELAMFKKGRVNNGAGIREYFVSLVDAHPYITSDVEKTELKRYITDMFESTYMLNMQRMYPSTIGRIQFRTLMSSEQGVLDAVDLIKDSILTSEAWDEYGLMVTMLQSLIVNGNAPIVNVDMSDLKNFIIKLRALAKNLTRPKRKYNIFGVPNNTPLERQYIMLTDELEAEVSVKVLADAFNRSDADYMQKRKTVESFVDPFDMKRYNELREINPELPEFDANALATLNRVKAILFDERLIQVYDLIREMWEKELASTMEINYFYHVWQVFALSPFANVVVIMDDATPATYPDTLEATVTAKYMSKSGGVVYNIAIKQDPNSIAPAQLMQTDAAAEAGIFVMRGGEVKVPEGASAQIGATAYDADYTSSVISTTLNVGDTVSFDKV